MKRENILRLMLLVTSVCHVTSFAVHRRHGRSTDLAKALRMLERQRNNIESDEEILLPSTIQGLRDRPLTLDDLEPWLMSSRNIGNSENHGNDENAAWMAKTLGFAGYDDRDLSPDEVISRKLVSDSRSVEPTDKELDAIFGSKGAKEEANDFPSSTFPIESSNQPIKKSQPEKEDQSIDLKPSDLNIPEVSLVEDTRLKSVNAVLSDVRPDDGDVRLDSLTKEEFKALLKAVEKLQKEAISKAASEVKEVEEAVAEDVAKTQQAAAAATTEQKSSKQTPQPVSDDELDKLFEEKTEEVIPTKNGEIVKTDVKIKTAEGRPIGEEEIVKQVASSPDKATLSSIEQFWYLNNYLDPEVERKKRNSRDNPADRFAVAPGQSPFLQSVSPLAAMETGDSTAQISFFIDKINQLQTELDQARVESYLEDVENDILTEALNEATLAQANGKVLPREFKAIADAIRVEEALQDVRRSRQTNDNIPDDEDTEDEISIEEKRGEPWRKKSNPAQSEAPLYLTGDSEDDDSEDENVEDLRDESRGLALRKWFANYGRNDRLEEAFDDDDDESNNDDDGDDDVLQDIPAGFRGLMNKRGNSHETASLFSNKADDCPAVREFSTNCRFADQHGLPIDFEARALCNVHEMCYACGQTLEVQQGQCDFIYRAASTLLCKGEEDCVLEAEEFLRTMKLKHRYVPYKQFLCSSKCTAEFLSII